MLFFNQTKIHGSLCSSRGQPDKGRRVRLRPSGAVLGHLRTRHQSPDALAGWGLGGRWPVDAGGHGASRRGEVGLTGSKLLANKYR